jgi:hypothetical protein
MANPPKSPYRRRKSTSYQTIALSINSLWTVSYDRRDARLLLTLLAERDYHQQSHREMDGNKPIRDYHYLSQPEIGGDNDFITMSAPWT